MIKWINGHLKLVLGAAQWNKGKKKYCQNFLKLHTLAK